MQAAVSGVERIISRIPEPQEGEDEEEEEKALYPPPQPTLQSPGSRTTTLTARPPTVVFISQLSSPAKYSRQCFPWPQQQRPHRRPLTLWCPHRNRLQTLEPVGCASPSASTLITTTTTFRRPLQLLLWSQPPQPRTPRLPPFPISTTTTTPASRYQPPHLRVLD